MQLFLAIGCFFISTLLSGQYALVDISTSDSLQFELIINAKSVSDSLQRHYNSIPVYQTENELIIRNALGHDLLKQPFKISKHHHLELQLFKSPKTYTLLTLSDREMAAIPNGEPNLAEADSLPPDTIALKGNCAPLLTEEALDEIWGELNKLNFQTERISYLEKRLTKECFSCQQMARLLSGIDYDDHILLLLQAYAPVSYNPEQLVSLSESLTLELYKKQWLSFLARHNFL